MTGNDDARAEYGDFTGHFCLMLVCLSALVLAGCGANKSSEKQKVAPAKLEHPDEGDIYRVVLTPKAEERLQISTAAVEKRAVPRTRIVGGNVMIPDGRAVIVTAPVSGMLRLPDNAAGIVAGQKIAANEVVFQLEPLLAPEREVPSAAERIAMANAKASLVSSQIIAEGDVKQGEAQVEAATIALARTQRLFNDKVGSQRDVDDAIARLEIAEKGLEAAKARKQLLDQLTLDAESVQAIKVDVPAPQNGILRNVTAKVGQVVTAGTPLFEVANLQTMWVRVGVYPGLDAAVDREGTVRVRRLGSTSEVALTPVAAPPSADLPGTSVNLFYELANEAGQFSPGEGVEVILPLAGQSESLVVPRAAILLDIHGVAWVYVNSADHEFRRHRVEVVYTTEESAILSEGPAPGTRVVVDGAAELFGTEFGAGK